MKYINRVSRRPFSRFFRDFFVFLWKEGDNMKSSNMILDQLETEVNKFSTEEKELFIKGKEFIDKFFENNNQSKNRVMPAVICYFAYKASL